MKTLNKTALKFAKTIALSSLLALSSSVFSAPLPALVDDFCNATDNNLSIARQFMSDAIAGGNTKMEPHVSAGIMQVKGDIVPPRGQPGWASSILPLSAEGMPEDASQFDGIKLVIKIRSGNMTISANSTEIDNFDYHAAPLTVPTDGKFHEVKIPFESMKRAWSQPTPLNAATLNSLSIVAFSLQPASFDFEVDEVSFY
ncbi:hypothetical protein AX660_00485 [Paraglaciecola hydrolytica]|uniref:NADH:ubiquinone oxidoreductase intermediate-associated protein 30 domain-containing protein n=2 Tax=Paraglaciecola hydrolytica TaxID=1799789 RepID=A0A136A732_9ALTE|nr:hypothetical protein AX660_00485 [Paraglaciecola hydrolytica]